jgi:hypothetical protein
MTIIEMLEIKERTCRSRRPAPTYSFFFFVCIIISFDLSEIIIFIYAGQVSFSSRQIKKATIDLLG